jgi:hypothetical protein
VRVTSESGAMPYWPSFQAATRATEAIASAEGAALTVAKVVNYATQWWHRSYAAVHRPMNREGAA